jgi:hypothetical protein
MGFSEAVKREVKQKAHYRCVWCGSLGLFLEVHHLTPSADGGADDVENAAPVCPNCHTMYGHNPEFRKELRERRDFWWGRSEQESVPSYAPLLQRTNEIIERVSDIERQGERTDEAVNEVKSLVLGIFKIQTDGVSSASTVSQVLASSTSQLPTNATGQLDPSTEAVITNWITRQKSGNQ